MIKTKKGRIRIAKVSFRLRGNKEIKSLNVFYKGSPVPTGIHISEQDFKKLMSPFGVEKSHPDKVNLEIVKSRLAYIKDKIESSQRFRDVGRNDIEKFIVSSLTMNEDIMEEAERLGLEPRNSLTVLEAFNNFIDWHTKVGNKNEDTGKQTSIGRLRRYRTTRNKIQSFIESGNRNIFLTQLSAEWLENWGDSMKHLDPETADNNIKVFKRMLRWTRDHEDSANRYENVSEKLLKKLKPHKVEDKDFIQDIKKVIITSSEFKALIGLELKIKKYDVVRDWFLVSALTGARISDFLEFTSSKNISEKGSKKYIVWKAKKTGKTQEVPSNCLLEVILSKYDGEFPPRLSESIEKNKIEYNRILKEVFRLIGGSMLKEIDYKVSAKERVNGESRIARKPRYKLVASHLGRRFNVTALSKVMDSREGKRYTGHSDIKMFEGYIIDDDEYVNELDRLHVQRFNNLAGMD